MPAPTSQASTHQVGTQQLLGLYCAREQSAEQSKEHDMHHISYDRLHVQMTHCCFPTMKFMQRCEPSVTVTAAG